MSTTGAARRRGSWYMLTGVILGLAIGLLYAWVISPVKYVNTSPDSLGLDFKNQYRLMIASAYQATGNLGRAQARLDLLGDPDPVQALTDLTRSLQPGGDAGQSATALTTLIDALQQNRLGTPNSTTAVTQPIRATPILTPTASPAINPSSLAHPTYTPTRTPGAPFVVIGQENVCNTNLPTGLLQVEVRDAAGQPVSGEEIVVSWTGGEEHFFTGLKPELGNGYADFEMTPGVTYTLQLSANSTSVSGLTAPSCTSQDGKTYLGGIHVIFQQP